ncbi:MAG: hypothetical protein GY786_14085 [Proteobacteria bacterium]|nr:hypothetical protein [Pseudomonadota bacterium]
MYRPLFSAIQFVANNLIKTKKSVGELTGTNDGKFVKTALKSSLFLGQGAVIYVVIS